MMQALKKKTKKKLEESDHLENVLYEELTEGDGLDVVVFESYCQASGKHMQAQDTRDAFVAHASDDDVAIQEIPENKLPKVTMDMDEVRSSCNRLGLTNPSQTNTPKWMLINQCRMLE